MPRRSRFLLPGLPLHIVQRGNNRAPCFVTESDRALYLGLLAELAPRCNCSVHAFVLMTNHVHLLMTSGERGSASRLMKDLGQRYAQHFNRRYGRTGPFWDGRFRSNIVDAEGYLLRCQRYIELNPVRARMVASPGEHPWSSYRVNALGEPSTLVEPHRSYLALATSPQGRLDAYRSFCGQGTAQDELARIRSALSRGLVLGDEAFVGSIERPLGRPLESEAPGGHPLSPVTP